MEEVRRRPERRNDDDVHIDAVFIALVKGYLKLVEWVNLVVWVTKTATYKLVSGAVC